MKYRSLKGYKYQVAETFTIRLPIFDDVTVSHPMFTLLGGVLTVQSGYCWDGASGPTWDDKTNMTPSLVHDVLYQSIRAGLIPASRREDADYALNQLARDRGMFSLRRSVWFNGLNWLGFNAAKLRKVEPQDVILEAP